MLERVGQLVRAQDAERRRIARTLHDVVGHSLGRVLLELELLESARTEQEHSRIVAGLRDRISSAVADLDHLGRDLHPPALADLGLLSGVQQYVRDFEELHGLPVRLVKHPVVQTLALPDEVACAAFRVVEEGLQNVARHARASGAAVVLHCGDVLEVRVEDDGIGAVPNCVEGEDGTGLLSLMGRLVVLGGTLELRRAEPRGTILSANLPVEPRK